MNPPFVTLSRLFWKKRGYRVRAVPDFAAARKAIGRGAYDAVVTDMSLEEEGLGLELAREAKKLRSAPAVVVYTDRPQSTASAPPWL